VVPRGGRIEDVCHPRLLMVRRLTPKLRLLAENGRPFLNDIGHLFWDDTGQSWRPPGQAPRVSPTPPYFSSPRWRRASMTSLRVIAASVRSLAPCLRF